MGEAARKILLPPGGVGEGPHLLLNPVRHGVEVGGQPPQLVAAGDGHPLVQPALRHPPGGVGQPGQGAQNQVGHQQGERRRPRDKGQHHADKAPVLGGALGKQVGHVPAGFQPHRLLQQGEGAGPVEGKRVLAHALQPPAPLIVRQPAGGGGGVPKQAVAAAAAAQPLPRPVAELEVCGGGHALGQPGKLLPPGQGPPLRLQGENVAEHIVLLVQLLHLLVQGGAELPVNEPEPGEGAGQHSDGHHGAK